jgi:IgGFc binding protein/Cohesin domain
MVRSFTSRFCVFLFVAGMLFSPRFANAQAVLGSPTMLPRAGQNFSFGIIQGPDYLIGDSIASAQQTTLTLSVVSAYEGCGVVTSPSGYIQDFTFIPGAATIIDLPYSLLQLNVLGKSNKGLLVHTTEPANLVLHDYVVEAGDASQILPDNALDTSYVTFGWGIWDDPADLSSERNCNEFLVTAATDSTLVTITPSVPTLNGLPANVPVTVLLNRGECYIMKADTSDHPSDPSLSGSSIHSTKPVSVISGLTCGYVPVGEQSCNELMDELIGKKWWGSHFFAQPMGNSDFGVEMVLTSDRDFYAKFNNGFSNSTNGRLAAEFSGTAEIHTFDLQGNPVKVEAQQLTRGSDNYDFFDFNNLVGDPTLVTVLDTQYYTDTLVWNTPMLPIDPNSGLTFEHWVPIIVPTVDVGKVTMDGTPLTLSGAASSVINGSAYSAINPTVNPGAHKIISPDPIFALVTGFNDGDAYSFMAGSAGSQLPRDTMTHAVLLQADSGQACNDFIVSATLATAVLDSEDLISLTIPITYDPAMLHLVGIQPGTMLTSGNYSVDSSTPGFLTITVYGDPFITGSDLFKLIFEGWKSVAATTVGKNATPSYCGDDSETLIIQPVTFAVAPSMDSLDRQFILTNSGAAVCETLTIAITTDSIVTPGDEFVLSKIEVQFDTTTEHFIRSTRGALLKNVVYNETGQATGNYQLLVPSSPSLFGSDTLLLLQFNPQMVSAGDTMLVHIFYLECGDTLSRDFTITFPIVRNADTTHAVLTITTSSVTLTNQALADIGLLGLPAAADVEQFDLYLSYNHDVLTYDHADLIGTLTGTWPAPVPAFGRTTDTLHFTSLEALQSSAGILAHLWFKTFVADSSYTLITVTSSLSGTNAGCPIVFASPQASAMFLGKDACGDSLLRNTMLDQPIAIDRVEIATDWNLHIVMQTPTASNISLSLTDILGRTLWNGELNCAAGTTDRELALPQNLPTGPMMLRLMDGQHIQSRELLLVK